MDTQPIGFLETRSGFAAGFPEQHVVLVEALNQGERNLVRVGAIQAKRYLHFMSPDSARHSSISARLTMA